MATLSAGSYSLDVEDSASAGLSLSLQVFTTYLSLNTREYTA